MSINHFIHPMGFNNQDQNLPHNYSNLRVGPNGIMLPPEYANVTAQHIDANGAMSHQILQNNLPPQPQYVNMPQDEQLHHQLAAKMNGFHLQTPMQPPQMQFASPHQPGQVEHQTPITPTFTYNNMLQTPTSIASYQLPFTSPNLVSPAKAKKAPKTPKTKKTIKKSPSQQKLKTKASRESLAKREKSISHMLKEEINHQPEKLAFIDNSSLDSVASNLEHHIDFNHYLMSFGPDSENTKVTVEDILKDDPFAELTSPSNSNSDSKGLTANEYEADAEDDTTDNDFSYFINFKDDDDKPKTTGLGLAIDFENILDKVEVPSPSTVTDVNSEDALSPIESSFESLSSAYPSPVKGHSRHKSASSIGRITPKTTPKTTSFPTRTLKKAQSFAGDVIGTRKVTKTPNFSLEDCCREITMNPGNYSFVYENSTPNEKEKRSERRASFPKLFPKHALKKSQTSPVVRTTASLQQDGEQKVLDKMESGLVNFQIDMK